MPTANEQLFSLTLRHQIDLRRYSNRHVKDILAILEKVDQETTARLRNKLAPLAKGKAGGLTEAQQKRLEEILADVQLVRQAAWANAQKDTKQMMLDLSAVESDIELKNLEAAIPIQLKLTGVDVATVGALVVAKPFQGRLLGEWFNNLSTNDQSALNQAIKLGIAQGETLDQVVKRVAGTKANSYADGVMAISRRNAEAVVRTAITHVSNTAREETWKANADIIVALRWTATLDGRTSAICRARDGQLTPVGSNKLPAGSRELSPAGARPPAHVRCRSTMVPVLNGEEIVGERAFVVDTRTREQREVDFRQEAKDKAGDSWSELTTAEKNAAVKRVRQKWVSENIGQVPSDVSYGQWLAKQPASFQDDVLGQTKGRLFRQGGLKLDQFVDKAGNELTLDELKNRYPSAWDRVR